MAVYRLKGRVEKLIPVFILADATGALYGLFRRWSVSGK